MSPKSIIDHGNVIDTVYHVITESWGLEKITDALPGTLNPHRHKDAFEWGPDLLFKLHELAQLTPGRHARVVEGLKLRVSQRHSSVRPNFAPWTIPEDVKALCAAQGIEKGAGPEDEIWFGSWD